MSEQPEAAVPDWDLADRMRKALRHADMGVAEMADYLGVSRTSVSNWINGARRAVAPDPAAVVPADRCQPGVGSGKGANSYYAASVQKSTVINSRPSRHLRLVA